MPIAWSQAKTLVNGFYAKDGNPYNGVKGYGDYRELLANKDIDAVVISTPDHQHAVLAVNAVRAGKDVYLQKPASLTIAEGRYMADAVKASGRIFQIGSQQRSWKQFHRACELVRNGRIGEVKHVEIGLPGDPSGPEAPEMPVPPNLNYDAWLGTTPVVYYTEMRVHPQEGFGRPGWLRCEQFGAGMITGWGAHHVDTAHWGMNTELTGPVEIWGTAEFPAHGLWNVHGKFKTEAPVRQRHDHVDLRRLSRTASSSSARRDGSSSPATECDGPTDPKRALRGPAAGGERSEDSGQRDRPQRDPPVPERRAPRQLARLRAQPQGTGSPRRRSRTAPAPPACCTTSR